MSATGVREAARATPPEPAEPVATSRPEFIRGLLFALPLVIAFWLGLAALLLYLT
jgi:hypothetical protein